MGLFLKENEFKIGYKKRPNDEYKALISQLDEKTKNKMELQRTLLLAACILFVFAFVMVLALTGVGVDKSKSASGNVFVDKESVSIECFGDSLTEGYIVKEDGSAGIAEQTYPKELQTKLTELLHSDGNNYKFQELIVRNYGQSGSILQSLTYTRLSGTADIVVILYTANNFLTGADYEGTLEANIDAVKNSGSQVFLVNYPICASSENVDKFMQANNYISSTAKLYELDLIDLNAYFSDLSDYTEEELFCRDKTHLTELGYQLMGDYIAECIHQYYYEMY